MANRRAARKERNSEVDRALEALESGLKGLGDISEDLEEVRENLRKYIDEAERSLGRFPRLIPRLIPRPRRKTRRR